MSENAERGRALMAAAAASSQAQAIVIGAELRRIEAKNAALAAQGLDPDTLAEEMDDILWAAERLDAEDILSHDPLTEGEAWRQLEQRYEAVQEKLKAAAAIEELYASGTGM